MKTLILTGTALLPIVAGAQSVPIEFKGIPLGAPVAAVHAQFKGVTCRTSASCYYEPSRDVDKVCRTDRGPDGKPLPSYMRDTIMGRDTACYSEGTKAAYFGPTLPKHYLIYLSNETVVGVDIQFDQTAFQLIARGLVEKYGPPTSDVTANVQNRMGATFDDRTLRWDRSDGVIVARQRAGGIDISSVEMRTPTSAAEERERIQRQGKAVAKQL